MNFREEMKNQVYAALNDQYSKEDIIIKKHLDEEIELIDQKNLHENFMLMKAITTKCLACNQHFSTSLDGFFAAYLLGIARYNPLPTQFKCSKCKTTSFESENLECLLCGSEMAEEGVDIQINPNERISSWIRVAEEFSDTIIKELRHFSENDMLDSEKMFGIRYILHPKKNSGLIFDVLSVKTYSILNKLKNDPNIKMHNKTSFLTTNFETPYLPGFFTDTEWFRINRSKPSSLKDLSNLIYEYREVSKAQAFYLATTYLESVYYTKKAPAIWFVEFLKYLTDFFDYNKMGRGKENCSQERLRYLDYLHITDGFMTSGARNLDEIFSLCEGAYDWGITFLPPNPMQSKVSEFTIVSSKVILSPVPFNSVYHYEKI